MSKYVIESLGLLEHKGIDTSRLMFRKHPWRRGKMTSIVSAALDVQLVALFFDEGRWDELIAARPAVS